jgi:hypothetical protein
VIVGVFLHCLAPLEVDMAELVETYANTMTWYSTHALGPTLALAAAYHGLF